MRFKQFITEKKRYRMGPDGQYVPVDEPAPQAPAIDNPSPAYPMREPISNMEKRTVDFDPTKVGKVAKPRQRIRAGDEPQPRVRQPQVRPTQARPTAIPAPLNDTRPLGTGPMEPPPQPVNAAPQQQNIAPPTLEPLSQGPMQPEPGHEPTSLQQIIAVANNAAANGSMSVVDQLIRMAGEVRSHINPNNQGNYLMKPNVKKRNGEARAKQVAQNLNKTMDPNEKQSFMQSLNNIMSFRK